MLGRLGVRGAKSEREMAAVRVVQSGKRRATSRRWRMRILAVVDGREVAGSDLVVTLSVVTV